jgi:DNA polymerase III sliding clamp (beta) subunit (PCNA family)
MKKESIENFINRYSLGGEIESVKINSNDDSMDVNFISDDKTLLGSVSADNGNFPNGEFGIYTTSKLKSLLTVLESSVNIKSAESYIKFSDNNTSVNYMLADLSVIPAVPDLKQLPPFDVDITLDNDFTSKFIKSKSALSESDTFTFECKDGNGEIILGYSTLNTNRISMKVDCKCSGDIQPISFSARYLKEILNSNRGSKSATLKISSKGLAHVSFTTDEIKSDYYLVEIK